VNEKYNNLNYKVLPTTMFFDTFQIQRYRKNVGKYIYHNDWNWKIINNNNSYRVLTYLWYLNNVEEGGETEICVDLKIKPEIGKLIIFPASWLYPHCGRMPISNDKYILTGWIYGFH
jgi:hypothetical protein